MASFGSDVKHRRRRALPTLPPDRESVIKQKFEIPEFDVERLHKLPPKILNQINAVEKDNTIVRGKIEDLKDRDPSRKGSTSQITLKSGKKLEISLVEGSFRRIAGIREQQDDSGSFTIRTVEIKREPGKSLGFFIRQGDGWMRKDGIFVSRVNLGSLVEVNGLLHVGDEITKVNSVDVTNLALDDVVVIMQYVKKMVLTIKILTSVTLTRAFSTRLQKRTPKQVATVRRTSSYAEKIAIRQKDDSLSNNDEMKFGNPYEDVQYKSQDKKLASTASEEPTAEVSQLFKTTGFYDDSIKLGNPYDDINYDEQEKPNIEQENIADTKLDKPAVHSSPTYEEIADVVASSDSQTLDATKQDITGWDDAKQEAKSDSPLASSTPVLHRKLDTLVITQQETTTPQLVDSGAEMLEKSLDMEDLNEHRISFDTPPIFKPPPPPSDDYNQEEARPTANESSHGLNLTNVTNEDTTTSITISSDLKLDDIDTDSENDSIPPPIPPFRLNVEEFDDLSEFQPPPLPSKPPPKQDENNTSTDNMETLDQIHDATLPKSDETESTPNKLYSGMLAATIYGIDEDTTLSRSSSKHTFSCTIAIDSVVRVKHVFKFSANSLERSLGEELDPFHIDLQNNQEATITLYKDSDPILEKTVQFTDLFGSDIASKESQVHELHLSASPLGKLILSLEYQPMSVYIKRMSSESSQYSCATFQDYVMSSPSSSEYPIVVERCIKIIEEYGLREPGLYQLCVSESSKNEAFQLSLSQTKKQAEVRVAVSQLSIHAFTGVLKDFFRNLPEPLLTNDTSLSTTEAASMENSVVVGADVMKGFINCLPEEVLSTFQLLLGHFQRACQHGLENGLSVEKISLIFGPLLLAPSCNADKNTSTAFSTEYAEDYDSQAKVIAILMSQATIEHSPYVMHKV